MTKKIKCYTKNGNIKIQEKRREKAIEVVCTHCHRKRMTLGNDRCLCFYCGKTFKIKGDYHD